MALPWDKRDFASWREALVQHRLTDKQIDLLEGMVQEGQAESVQAAPRCWIGRKTLSTPMNTCTVPKSSRSECRCFPS